MKTVRTKRQTGARALASKTRLSGERRARSSRKQSRNRVAARRREDTRPSQRHEGSANSRRSSFVNQQSLTAKKEAEARYLAAVDNLESALRHMQKQNYAKAGVILQKLVNGPVVEVADRARVHLCRCESRLSPSVPAPKSAEDLYNLGVFELNAQALDQAVEHLGKAAKMKPDQEHLRYALASAYALRGDAESALAHLSKAIALRPANRYQVQLDQDFASLADSPRFRQLVGNRRPVD
jgi:tetratricopeptide (TPR) repeat protein